jgi:uncharacterized protein (TIGR02594 family)
MAEPKWLEIAKGDLDIGEKPGPVSHERIAKAFGLVGLKGSDDGKVSWCSAMCALWLHESGQSIKGVTGAARSWLNWGSKCDPKQGCVVVLWRNDPNSWQGHVGLLVRVSDTHVYLLGGNQSDRVSVASFPLDRVLGYRWPASEPFTAPIPTQKPPVVPPEKAGGGFWAWLFAFIRKLFRRQ